ncbi:MAG: site-2 protease family protein [Victivallaceae bacterium]|nr:site-2 protease family protein [Victivallaceae bacterium]
MVDFWDFLSIVGAVLFMLFFGGMCIFIHELGHFFVAKWRGLHIDAFSIGFKKIWSKKVNGVEYRIGCLPFGGYVELPQIDAADEEPKAADGTKLPRATPVSRIATAVAGPLSNIALGFLLGCLLWAFGMPQDSPKMRAIEVAAVIPDSPEYRAGLRAGDVIVKVNHKNFRGTWMEFVQQVLFTVGEVELDVRRGGATETIRYTPEVNPHVGGKLKFEKIAYPFFRPRIPIELYPGKGGIAESAGMRSGDVLLAVNGHEFTDFSEFQYYIDQAGSRPLDFQIRRKSEVLNIKITPVRQTDVPEDDKYLFGFSFEGASTPLRVVSVGEFLPAAEAGMLPGDRIVSVDGKALTDAQTFFTVENTKMRTVTMQIERAGKTKTIQVSSRKLDYYTIDAAVGLRDYPTPWQVFVQTIDMSYKSLRGMAVYLGNKMQLTTETSSIKPRHMSGPIGMGRILFESVRNSSFMTGIYFVTVISFALAIFNLLPLPVLDGGHVLFGVIELIFGKPLPSRIIKSVSVVFVTLLVALMLYVSFYDVLRLYNDFRPAQSSAPTVKQPQSK